jgi:hypothetical protein
VGWYFRKSVGFGPFRLNLSKSGIGYSFGVRGARIGSGARGNYIRLGRDGIYYQKYIRTRSAASGASSGSPMPGPVLKPEADQHLETVEPSALQDASAADLIREINQKRSKAALAPIPAALFFLTLLGILALAAPAGQVNSSSWACYRPRVQWVGYGFERSTKCAKSST